MRRPSWHKTMERRVSLTALQGLLFRASLVVTPFGCPLLPYAFALRGPMPGRLFDVVLWIAMLNMANLLAVGCPGCGMDRTSARRVAQGLYAVQFLLLGGPAIAVTVMYDGGLDALKTVALTCGTIGAWTAAWSLVPISRCAPILTALGIPVDAGLRAHALIGRATAIILTCHAASYVLYWFLEGGLRNLKDELSKWNSKGVNNLAGVLSFVALAVSVVVALGPVRRRAYQVFYRFHLLGFIAFALFGAMHWAYFGFFLIPPITLWISDLARRALDCLSAPCTVRLTAYESARLIRLRMTTTLDGGVCCPASRALAAAHRSGGFSVYATVCIPALTPLEWHPFTLMPGWSRTGTFEIWIRARGDWTNRLLSLTDHSSTTTARVAGLSSAGWRLMQGTEKKKICLVAGGTGIVPLLNILDRPGAVKLLWIIRHTEDLAIFESYCASMTDRKSELSLIVCFTGPEDDLPDVSTALDRCSTTTTTMAPGKCERGLGMIRALHAAVLMGTIVGAVVSGVVQSDGWPDWQVGAVNFALLCIGAAIGGMLCCCGFIFGSSLRSPASDVMEMNPVIRDSDEVKNRDAPETAPWTNLRIQPGRPDVAKELQGCGTVLVSGPPSLVHCVQEVCCKGQSRFFFTIPEINCTAVSFDMSDL